MRARRTGRTGTTLDRRLSFAVAQHGPDGIRQLPQLRHGPALELLERLVEVGGHGRLW
jgi:hypothetical protein